MFPLCNCLLGVSLDPLEPGVGILANHDVSRAGDVTRELDVAADDSRNVSHLSATIEISLVRIVRIAVKIARETTIHGVVVAVAAVAVAVDVGFDTVLTVGIDTIAVSETGKEETGMDELTVGLG